MVGIVYRGWQTYWVCDLKYGVLTKPFTIMLSSNTLYSVRVGY